MDWDAYGVRLRSRLILMLVALERAGVSPVEIHQLHAFAFFANVLSPLWNLEPLRGSVLKRKTGPFYKELQDALDELVGLGLVECVELDYREIDEDKSRLAATFRIVRRRVEAFLSTLRFFPDELQIERYLE